jgi:hypothetical protein
MTEQRKRLNKKALTGFTLTVLSPVFVVLIMAGYEHPFTPVTANTLLVILAGCAFSFFLVGGIFSVIGLIMSIVKNEKGKGFAVAGIVISQLEFIFLIFCFMLLLVFMFYSDSSMPVT